MASLYLKYLHFSIHRPWFMALIGGLILALSFPVLTTKVNNNMEEWFPANSPQLVAKRQFIQDFGNDELIFVLLTFPEHSSERERIHALDTLSHEFDKIGGIDQVLNRNQLSISGIPGISGQLKRLERLFFDTENPNVEMIYIRPRMLENFDLYRPKLLDSVNNSLPVLDSNIRVDITGSGVVFSRIEELTNRDSGLLFSLCFLLIFGMLAIRLRNWRKMGISVGLFLLLFVPAFSLFSWLGISVSLITMVVPLLLIINFFAYILHLHNRPSADLAIFIQKKLSPIVYSAITTMIGFGSLMLSHIQVIFHFGLLTLGGVCIGLVVLLLVGIPILLASTKADLQRMAETNWLDSFLNGLNTRKSMIFVSATLLFMAIGGWTSQFIEVDTNSINFLPPSDSIRKSTDYIQQQFGSFNTIDFLIYKNDSSRLENEDFRQLRQVEKRVGELDFVNGVVSFNQWRSILRMANMADTNLSSSIQETYLTEDEKHSRLSLRIPLGSVQSMKADLRLIEAEISEVLKDSQLSMKAVGYLPIYIEHIDLIVSGMVQSLGLAIFFIGLAMIVMVGDIRLGLIALIPNTFPIFGVAVFMNMTGTPLDIATSIIGSVVIGLVVDDTLHIIWNFKREQAKGQNMDLKKVFEDILHPSTTTSLMFATGFMVLLASGIGSLNVFGKLVSAAILLGWIGDFIIFPAFLSLMKRKDSD